MQTLCPVFYLFKESILNQLQVWNQRLDFMTSFDDLEEVPPIVLTLWDWNQLSLVFIGSSILQLDKSDLDSKEISKPKSYKVNYGFFFLLINIQLFIV